MIRQQEGLLVPQRVSDMFSLLGVKNHAPKVASTTLDWGIEKNEQLTEGKKPGWKSRASRVELFARDEQFRG